MADTLDSGGADLITVAILFFVRNVYRIQIESAYRGIHGVEKSKEFGGVIVYCVIPSNSVPAINNGSSQVGDKWKPDIISDEADNVHFIVDQNAFLILQELSSDGETIVQFFYARLVEPGKETPKIALKKQGPNIQIELFLTPSAIIIERNAGETVQRVSIQRPETYEYLLGSRQLDVSIEIQPGSPFGGGTGDPVIEGIHCGTDGREDP